MSSALTPPVSDRSRRQRVFVLVALLLALFAPRALGTVEHEHDTPHASSTQHCAACVIGHTPAATAPTGATLPAPCHAALATGSSDVQVATVGFSYASPLACGPPV